MLRAYRKRVREKERERKREKGKKDYTYYTYYTTLEYMAPHRISVIDSPCFDREIERE